MPVIENSNFQRIKFWFTIKYNPQTGIRLIFSTDGKGQKGFFMKYGKNIFRT